MPRQKRKLMTAREFEDYLKDRRIRMDCGHIHCQHHSSDTLVVTNDGIIQCSACYQNEVLVTKEGVYPVPSRKFWTLG